MFWNGDSLMARIKKNLMDWDEWLRPYVKECHYQRRKNQYCDDLRTSTYYAVDRVPIEVMIEHHAASYLKYQVFGKCVQCGTPFNRIWANYCQRTRAAGKILCGRCALLDAVSQEGWKNANSQAQFRIQGTPEARHRMSASLHRAWEQDPTIRVRISKSLIKTYDGNIELRRKIGDASRRNWTRIEYQEKVTGKGYHHGWFLSRYGKIYFASSWELMFLLWCETNMDVIRFGRNMDIIPYIKPSGGTACYHPDFEIVINDEVTVIEVKGNRSEIDLVERKRQAAEKFYAGNKTYSIIYKEDLQRMGIFHNGKQIGPWIQGLVGSGKIEGYGFGKHL